VSVILIDRMTTVVLNNGIVRVDCVASGPNGEERPSGTLLIPANQMGPLLQMLMSATQQLDKQLRQAVSAKPAVDATPATPERARSVKSEKN